MARGAAERGASRAAAEGGLEEASRQAGWWLEVLQGPGQRQVQREPCRMLEMMQVAWGVARWTLLQRTKPWGSCMTRVYSGKGGDMQERASTRQRRGRFCVG